MAPEEKPMVPWAEAVLDPSNSDLYRIELEGEPVPWEHRDSPEYFDDEGEPVLVVKPSYRRVDLRARSMDEAKTAALALHPDTPKVLTAKKIAG